MHVLQSKFDTILIPVLVLHHALRLAIFYPLWPGVANKTANGGSLSGLFIKPILQQRLRPQLYNPLAFGKSVSYSKITQTPFFIVVGTGTASLSIFRQQTAQARSPL